MAKKTLEISKKVPQAYITLVKAYFQLDTTFERSNRILDEGLCQNPDSAELWAMKGGYNYPHDYFAFRNSYEKALSLSPCDCKIYKEYIYLLLLSDEEEDAKAYYNQMLLAIPFLKKASRSLRNRCFCEFKVT